MTASLARIRPALAVAVDRGRAVGWTALHAGGATPGLRALLVVAVGCALSGRRGALPAMPNAAPGDTSGYAGTSSAWSNGAGRPARGPLAAGADRHRDRARGAASPSRPWHTLLLGVVLIGYLITLHLTETIGGPSVFRPQLPFLAAGLCLAALSQRARPRCPRSAQARAGWPYSRQSRPWSSRPSPSPSDRSSPNPLPAPGPNPNPNPNGNRNPRRDIVEPLMVPWRHQGFIDAPRHGQGVEARAAIWAWVANHGRPRSRYR